jgi:hypothetical protein
MFRKVISGLLIISMVAIQAPVFAADNQNAAKGGNKQNERNEKVIVEGKNGPEIREITVTELTGTIKKTGKRYAVVDFPQELGIEKNAPILLNQLGLLIDQAIEAEDVSSLVALSLSLAAFEGSANKEAKSLTSKNILQIAGEMAKFKNTKSGLLQISNAYKESAYGLSDKTKADEFAQLAENTRMTDGEFFGGLLALAGAAIVYDSTHTSISFENYTSSSLKIYLNNSYMGTVGSYENNRFSTSSCDKDVSIDARDYSGDIVKYWDTYLSCDSSYTLKLR